MLIFAVLFAAVGLMGVCVGLGHWGGPLYHQSLHSYGWALALNGAALSAFFLVQARERLRHRP